MDIFMFYWINMKQKCPKNCILRNNFVIHVFVQENCFHKVEINAHGSGKFTCTLLRVLGY